MSNRITPMDLISYFSSLLSVQAWYAIIFFFSFLESLVVIGLLTPGTLVVLFAGFLISGGRLDFYPAFFLTVLGAVLGDLISFYLGEKGIKLFKEEARILKISRLKNGQEFFKKHGGKSIFFGRFIGPLRSIVPFSAGTFKMDYEKFLFWNLTSGAVWALLYLFLGLIFGEAWQTAERFATKAQIVLSIVAFMVIGFYLIRLYFVSSEGKLTIKTAAAIANFVKGKLGKLRFIKFIFARFNKKDFYGLPLTVLIIAFFYVLFFAFGFIETFILSGSIYATDIRVENLLFAFRDDELVRYFYFLTLLGNWQIITSFGVVLSVIFWLWRKKAYIFALWTSVLGTQLFGT
ncbi:MAG: DedA family protein, partial [Actinobacteria bacterium]|nr:DedA family protein [Actinomycetota bacterium]